MNLPCHNLEDLDITIDDKKLHHKTCSLNGYKIIDGTKVSKCCADLEYNTRLSKMLVRGTKGYQDENMFNLNNKYLSHSQLSQKANSLQEEKRKLRFQLTQSKFKCSKLCATLSLHE